MTSVDALLFVNIVRCVSCSMNSTALVRRHGQIDRQSLPQPYAPRHKDAHKASGRRHYPARVLARLLGHSSIPSLTHIHTHTHTHPSGEEGGARTPRDSLHCVPPQHLEMAERVRLYRLCTCLTWCASVAERFPTGTGPHTTAFVERDRLRRCYGAAALRDRNLPWLRVWLGRANKAAHTRTQTY